MCVHCSRPIASFHGLVNCTNHMTVHDLSSYIIYSGYLRQKILNKCHVMYKICYTTFKYIFIGLLPAPL